MPPPTQPAGSRDLPPGSEVVTLDCRHGTLSFFRSDDPIGRALLEYGEWAEHEIALLLELVDGGDTVLDVGANVGTHTLPLARRVGPGGRVIAFEPQGRVFELLRENATRNGLTTIEARREGVAGAPGEMRVPRVDYASHVNVGGVALVAAGAPEGERVPVTSVDALELTRCDLMKVDAEGMELDVLRGASRTILRCAPMVYAECTGIEPGWEVARFARELGHRVLLHRAQAFNPENYFGNAKNTFGLAHETSLLVVPPSRSDRLAPLAARRDLVPIASLDDLARAMMETPRWGDPEPRAVPALEQARQIAALSSSKQRLEAHLAKVSATALEREERSGELERALADAERRLAEREREDAERAAKRARGTLREAARRIRDALRRLRGRRVPGRQTDAERLVAASGLFDPAHYRARNPDLAGLADRELVRHFVNHGGREGRDPCPLFDASYYLDENPDVRADGMNPLVHFLRHGSAEGRNPNALFDLRFYARHPRVASSGLEPLLHYLRFGAAARLDPSPAFDTAAYLEENPDAREAGVNPLAHHLAARRSERGAPPDQRALRRHPKAPRPVAPTREDWATLLAERAPRPAGGPPAVDVIVPVYRGFDDTLRCLYSVLSARCATPHAVVVIDDASPERELREELRFLAGKGLVELVRNERNVGFVATCNRGMSLHPERDVVLLNSDTEVYGDWLDRLRAAALRSERVGSVTPLSNSATICSYPHSPSDNDMALELEYAELDRLAATVNAGEAIPLPTAIGFCMYVRRPLLDEVGLFDLERFGRGYGEENDLCLRAAARGWTHVLASDVFVRHTGGVSFGPEKQARVEQALVKVHERFPDYLPSVNRFVEADPPREARGRLDVARLAARVRSRSILFVTHEWGGGVERHAQELRGRLEAEGVAVFFLRPHPEQRNLAILSHPDVWPTPNLGPFRVGARTERLAAALRRLRVGHVHVHSLVGFDQPRAAEWIPLLCRDLGVAYDFTVHDYLCICPRINLIDASGLHCGEPDIGGCERCVEASGSPFGKVSVQRWVSGYERLLRGARAVFAPGKDAADRIAAHFPGLTARVQAHLEAPPPPPAPREGVRAGARRVAVIGAIGPHKGFHVLRACADDAEGRKLPLSFHVVGYTCDDPALSGRSSVSVLGRYEEAALPRLLAEQRCDCAFFPSVWPETYSYTLSAALSAGLYPIAFDLGVLAERIRELGWGTLIPLTSDPVAVNDALLAVRISPPPDWEQVRSRFTACRNVVRDYYGLAFAGGEGGAVRHG